MPAMQSGERVIRAYRESDLPECAALYCNTFSAPPWNEHWTTQIAEQRISELMCSPLSVGYLLEENGVLLGMLIGSHVTYLYGRELLIHELCVLPDRQRGGVGSALLQSVTERLREESYAGIFLNTTHGYPSERFYLKNGFERQQRTVALYRRLK